MSNPNKIPNILAKKLKIDRRFFGRLIGPRGEVVNSLKRDFCVDVQIPRKNVNMNEITIYGEQSQVEKCVMKINEILGFVKKDENITVINVSKDLQRLVIGRGGQTVRKIRLENNVQVEVPDFQSNSTEVTLRGTQENTAKAKKAIEDILASVIRVTVPIPAFIWNEFIERGRLKSQYQSKVPWELKVIVTLSRSLKLFGPKEDVNQFRDFLTSSVKELTSQNALEMSLDDRMLYYMRFFDRSGLFKKVHEELKVNIDCNNKDKILLCGQNANIALQEIKKVAETMGPCVENQINAKEVREAAAFAEFFVTQIYLKTLREQYRVLVGPLREKDGNSLDLIRVYGTNVNVDIASVRINKIVEDWKEAVHIEVQFPPSLLNEIYRNMKFHILPIMFNLDVLVKLPSDLNLSLTVFGKKEKCLEAIRVLKTSIKIVKIVKIPVWYHGYLIGRGGSNLKKIINQIVSIDIRFPKRNEGEDVVFIGTLSAIEDAERLMAKSLNLTATQWKNPKQLSNQIDRLVDVQMNQRSTIIGTNGEAIKALEERFDVVIVVPDGDADPTDNQFIVRGLNIDQCSKAVDEIKKLIGINSGDERKVPSTASCMMENVVPPRIIPMLIGKNHQKINAFEKQYNVNVKFREKGEPHPEIVLLYGETYAEVEKALKAMDNIIDRTLKWTDEKSMSQQTEVPDILNKDEFPSINKSCED
ncbi:hypothetical protein ACOME3_002990 [Neoechinorhynchus agilis]